MYRAWDSRVVGRIDARVDSRYRNHRCTVHARPARVSRDAVSQESLARSAAERERCPPRPIGSARPNTFGAKRGKYLDPCVGLSQPGTSPVQPPTRHRVAGSRTA